MVSFLLSKALVAVLLLSSLNAFILNAEENDALQRTCGTNMKEVDRYARKVLNGVPAHVGEAPWTVAVYLPNHLDKTLYTTGTLISDRHIISYDQLFLTNTTDGVMYRHNLEKLDKRLCRKDWVDLVLPKAVVRRVSVFADLLKADRFSGREELQVANIRILKGCVAPYELNRIAIIELLHSVEEKHKARPACVGADIRPNSPFTFYGFGDNRGEVMDATLRHTEVTEVPCDIPSDEFFCVTAQEPLCNGDFGGAAVKRVSGSIKAYGVYVNGPYECSKADRDTVYTFANLTRLAEDICDSTGACPTYLPEETTEMPDTTTESYYTTEDSEQEVPPVIRDGSTYYPEYHTTTPGYTGEEKEYTTTAYNGADDTTTAEYDDTTTTASEINEESVSCVPELDDDDIHIHIKLGKYIKTGNEMDIEIIRQGPNKLKKRSI
ncbi:unnamed protein product [Caenorhabditis brenneri]